MKIYIWIIFLLCNGSNSIKWLGLSQFSIGDGSNKKLDINALLDQRQIRMVKRDEPLPLEVKHAATNIIAACEAEFNVSRWNCSSLRNLPSISPELRSGTREQAYVYALSSAILSIDISRACSTGKLKRCSCHGRKRPSKKSVAKSQQQYALLQPYSKVAAQSKFQREGCEMAINYALKFSERFTDSGLKKYKKQDVETLSKRGRLAIINMHNTKIGREIVKNSEGLKCKCHGVSGSCEIKTCWKYLEYKKALADLKEKYFEAMEIAGKDSAQANSGLDKRELSPHDEKLVFYTISSDYCNRDYRRGSTGTQGRLCGNEEKHNCDWMCCGRGYQKTQYSKAVRCRCQHIWCCYVKCDTCNTTVTEFRCK